MKEIIARNQPFTKEIWSREKAKQVFADKGEGYKVELVDAIPKARTSRSITRATGSTFAAGRIWPPRADRHGLQADEGGRRLLAR